MPPGVASDPYESLPAAPADVAGQLLAIDDASRRRSLLEASLATCDPDILLPLLRAEAERYWSRDPHATVRLAEALVEGAGLAGREDQRALGMLMKGDALRSIGRYSEAMHLLDQAAAAFLAQQNQVGWARTRTGWVHAAMMLGRGDAALADVDRAYDVLVHHHEWLRAAALCQNTAVVSKEIGRYDDALSLYDRAVDLYARAARADPALRQTAEVRTARAKANKGIVLTLLGQFDDALAAIEEARGVFVRYGEAVSVFRQDHNIAQIYAGQGYFTRALHLLLDVLSTTERTGMPVDATWAALTITECYLGLNRGEEAAEAAEETTMRAERTGAPTEAAKARFYGSLAHARLGDVERALALLDEAAQTFASAGLTPQLGMVALQRASLCIAASQWAAALAEAERARALFAGHGLSVRRAQAEILQARAALALGDHAAATHLARSALQTTQERGVLWLVHEAEHLLGRIAGAKGDLGSALDHFEVAIRSVERVQSLQAIELRTNFLDDKQAVYHDAIDSALRLGAVERAFDHLERAKSRALVDFLANHPEARLRARDKKSQDLLDEIARLRAEHNWFYDRLYGHGFARDPRNDASAAETEALQESVRDRERRITRLLERLALEGAGNLEGVSLPPAGTRTARPPVDAQTVLLEYYIRDSAAAVFVATSHELTVVPLPIRPGELQGLLRRWQLNLGATAETILHQMAPEAFGRQARGILEALYRALVAPVAGFLAGVDRLVVIPYGLTHSVPFHALHDGRRYLIESHEVSACPSSSLLRLCCERTRRGSSTALVMAHSDGGRLPNVLAEAQAVSTLLGGERYVEEQATRAALVEAAPRHGVVHLAAHGEARLDSPTFAHLKLADGQLSTADVFDLRLDGALVTLSACETGRSLVTGGDELVGLSRGFLSAGAATLVQSLWRVEDGSTARLMERFYRALRAGLPKGKALQAAQLALLADKGVHPYFWAAFQLVGDAGPLAEAV